MTFRHVSKLDQRAIAYNVRIMPNLGNGLALWRLEHQNSPPIPVHVEFNNTRCNGHGGDG